MSYADKMVDTFIGIALVLAMLTSYIAGAIVTASEDSNLSAYGGLILLILVVLIFSVVKFAWKSGKGKN
jgi:uncharacterized membrane protein